MSGQSFVWSHFRRIPGNDESARCKHCPATIRCKGGTTSTMGKHLRDQHNISREGPASSAGGAAKRRRPDFDFVEDRDTAKIVSQLAAVDNIPFKTIAKSPTLRKLIEAYAGQALPRSPNTIRSLVLSKADEGRKKVRSDLVLYQNAGGSFSVAFDEASAVNSPNRYISITLRSEPMDQSRVMAGPDIYLGLVRLSGRATANNVAAAVKGRLADYEVNLRQCYFSVTDGASVMKSAAANLGLRSQLCMVHGLHIAISKVLLRAGDLTASQLAMNDVMTGEDDEIDVSDVDNSFEEDAGSETPTSPVLDDQQAAGEDVLDLSESDDPNAGNFSIPGSPDAFRSNFHDPGFASVKSIIDQLREVLKTIKRSGAKRDRLRQLTESQDYNGKPLQVLLDVRIRWYSTVIMLERAVTIMPALNALLEEFGMTPFSRPFRTELENILAVLLPFKQAMKTLCSSSATLMHADRSILWLLFSLQQNGSPMAGALTQSVITEIAKRRTPVSSLFQYLLNPAYNSAVELSLQQGPVRPSDLLDVIEDILRKDTSTVEPSAAAHP